MAAIFPMCLADSCNRRIAYEYEMIVVNGKSLLLYKEYTYSKRGPSLKHWYCSRKLTLQCGAKIKLNNDKQVVSSDTSHNHPAPKLYKHQDGSYIKVS
ncbi:hypothetical protein evm_005183 [Chilo suppressalis]|nr:hypothetical protein evm_005183 [Chilo suppressalis]